MVTSAEAVLELLELLGFADPVVGGGWGIDALVGEETREHRDLDLAVNAEALHQVLAALNGAGYTVTTDWLPVRVELTHPDGAIVDVHPVAWNADGDGIQQGLDGEVFLYPAAEMTTGTIGGKAVRCISAALQRRFHDGYDHSDRDRHDLAQLDRIER